MRSELCILPQGASPFADVFAQVDSCAVHDRLSRKQALQLRLLAEELTGMLPSLLKWSKGVFWLESTGSRYELHVVLNTFLNSIAQHEKLLSVSTSGKNAAAAGIMGKIRCAIEETVLARHSAGASASAPSEWTLNAYRQQVQNRNELEKWDELEKSIIANLADDVIVSIRGDEVKISVIKTFWTA